jgi:hypothetical protein
MTVIFSIVGIHNDLSSIGGQIIVAVAGLSGLATIGCFVWPTTFGQIVGAYLERFRGKYDAPTNNQAVQNENVGGSVVTQQGSNNTVLFVPPINPVANTVENQRLLGLFKSEILKIERNLNLIPECPLDQQKIMYTFELYKAGNPQTFQNTPIYSQYSREMLQFSETLREKLIDFYEIIQTIHRNENFDYPPGTNNNYFQIRAYFDNVQKARELVPKIKQLIQQELTQ